MILANKEDYNNNNSRNPLLVTIHSSSSFSNNISVFYFLLEKIVGWKESKIEPKTEHVFMEK